MKSTQTILFQFERTAAALLDSLKNYSEEQFAKKPDNDSWSMGQMYNHLVSGTARFPLQQIALCLDGKGSATHSGIKFPFKLFFLFGSMPPTRIKVPPSDTYTPKQPENIEAMRVGLEQLIKIMREIEPKIASSSSTHATAHPAFGYLTARQWFQLIEMHFRHHLQQKQRIENFLAQ
jgi:hypothetical protein